MPPKTLLEFPHESSKVAEHNINIQKFSACLCTNSEVSERKKEKKKTKLRINIPNEVNGLYSDNYKTLIEEIDDSINTWKDILCS